MTSSEIKQRIDNLELNHNGRPIRLWCYVHDCMDTIEIEFMYKISEGGARDRVRMKVLIERYEAERNFSEIFYYECVKFNDKINELLDDYEQRNDAFEEIEI